MRSLALLSVLVAASACVTTTTTPDGRVIEPAPERDREAVVDGETAEVRAVLSGDLIELEDGRRIRYTGVVAPKPGERWFEQSLAANRELVAGRRVRLEWYGEQQRTAAGAWLAYVLVPAEQFGRAEGHVFANWALIRSGAAKAATSPEHYRHKWNFARAEQRARAEGIGIWAP